MNSKQPGIDTSQSEVTSIGLSGFWLIVDDKEYFVPFADYPIFRKAALEHPERYPLTWH